MLSGINHGPNLGTDVFYSGTVSAAMEGTLDGLPALAVSSACFQWRQFEPAARLALDVAEQVLAAGWPEGLLLNLNVPALPDGSIAPLRWCRPGVRRYVDQFDRRSDPRGRTYYWLAGEVVNDLESAGAGPRTGPRMWPRSMPVVPPSRPCSRNCSGEEAWRPWADCSGSIFSAVGRSAAAATG